MRLVLDNDNCVLYDASPTLRDGLNKVMSYRVKGHQFAPSFRNGFWDGRIKLLRKTRDGGLRFPTGLLPDAEQVIANLSLEVPKIMDRRRTLGATERVDWLAGDIRLRDYQIEAVGAAVPTGRGILKLPIRSGKTVIAAALIHYWKRRSVFVATSQLILSQTVSLFRRIFGGQVGVVGDSEFKPRFITVASIQRLQRLDDKVKRLLAEADVLIVDEVHHMRGDSWRTPILNADARYKIGLSATATVSRKLCERSAVWLKSATGPILIDVSMSRLVDDGYIMPLDIVLLSINGMVVKSVSYQTAYEKLIVHNDYRNNIIVETAARLSGRGHKVLIDSGRLAHIRELYAKAIKRGLGASIIYGDVSSDKRVEILNDFTSGRKPILIGTVMGEGVDVPELSAVINAEGGKSRESAIQRMRNLTVHPDKKNAVLVDFIDEGNKYLSNHSQARLEGYRMEPIFNIKGPMVEEEFLKTLNS